jgi:hypothetical protein
VFQAPAGDGGILAVPEFEHVPQLIAANRSGLDRADVRIDGMPLREYRSHAREEILRAAREYTSALSPLPDVLRSGSLLLAGHQPELFHPGVWVKNFALQGLARKVGGIPLNLIVDNDTLDLPALRFPFFRAGDPASVHQASIAFDRASLELPYETRTVLDEELFRSYPERTFEIWRNWGYQPLLAKHWCVDPRPGDAFTRMRKGREAAWGCHNLELPVSRLCQTTSFQRFARDILANLPRFRAIYNGAILAHRRANGIRSRNHPAPELEPNEAPFWVWKGPRGQRDRAYATSELRALRPRAFTLTLFARVCLGDFFIHGIGGGKYDEATDEIIRNYYGLEAPAYQVLTATLHLPLPKFPTSAGDLSRLLRLRRELRWNPQRHIDSSQPLSPAVMELLERKSRLIADEPDRRSHAERRVWYRSLQGVTQQLAERLGSRMVEVDAAIRDARQEVEANSVLQRRDYSWVLYPEESLKPFLQRFLDIA